MKTNKSAQDRAIKILFTHYGGNWIRGSERCLLDLLNHINRDKFQPVVWCNSPVMLAEVRALGITAYDDNFPLLFHWEAPRLNFIAFFSLIKKGIKLVTRHNIQLLHANSAAPNQWLNFVARICRIPLLSHLHSTYQLRDCASLGLHQVPLLVGVSQTVIDSLSHNGIKKSRCRIIPNGIDQDYLDQQPTNDLRTKLKLKPKDFIIATTASLIKRKGIDLLIEATLQLSQQGLPIHLVVIGEGEERSCLEQQIKQLDLSRHVSLLGEQANVVGLLRNSVDVFVSAAREEVFGLALAEASLMRLPVVATAVGGVPGVIKHNVSGLLVKANNSAALAKAISHLYKKPELRKALGNSGREHVLENFTIQRYTNDFEELYLTAIKNESMQSRWYRHWQVGGLLLTCLKRLLSLMQHRINR